MREGQCTMIRASFFPPLPVSRERAGVRVLIEHPSLAHDYLVRVPRDNDRRLLRFARNMRKSSTDAEAKLWSILRSRCLAGYKFRRQHRLAGYILDFYCIRRRVAVELDGAQHGDSEAIVYDVQRTGRLEALGVRVIRFSDVDLLKDTELIAEEIFRQVEDKNPHPNPLPAYRERGQSA